MNNNNPNTENSSPEVSAPVAALPDYQVAAQELQAFYETLRVTSEISGAHAAIDDESGVDGKGWAHVALTVTFFHPGGDNGPRTPRRPSISFSTPYKMGVGLVDWKKIVKSPLVRYSTEGVRECEMMMTRRLIPAAQALIAGKHLSSFVKRVSPAEVLASCCRDGLDASRQSFESWASEYGYDTDSRKAEEIYRACQKSGDGVRKLLSHARGAVEKLAELSSRL